MKKLMLAFVFLASCVMAFAGKSRAKEFYEIKKCHICGPEYYADSIAFKIENLVKMKMAS